MKQHFFGIDIGGTRVKCGCFGRTMARCRKGLQEYGDGDLGHRRGGGILIDGHIVPGAFGAGGEIGHIPVCDAAYTWWLRASERKQKMAQLTAERSAEPFAHLWDLQAVEKGRCAAELLANLEKA